ncbi:MAG: hypothetical protein AAFZ07_13060 [Actinomycetota bacterium]
MGSSGTAAPPAPPLFDRRAIVRGIARSFRRLLAVVVVALVLFLLVVNLVPVATGGSSFTVEDGSGPSVLAEDSLAFVEPVRVGAVEAGDILVTTEVPSESSTRRVVSMTRDGDVVVEAVDGGAPEVLDPTLIDGRVWMHLRTLGAVRDVLMMPLSLLALAGTALVLLVRARLDRRAAAQASARRSTPASPGPAAAAAPEPPAGPTIRVQVLLALMTEVDDVALRFALAEMGGSVVGTEDDQARLVRLVGTRYELDRAEARLADLGRVDAVRRSDEMLVPVPGPSSSAAA